MNTPELRDYLEKFTKEFNLAHESLTAKQLAEAIRQALACGDFILNVVKRDVPVDDNPSHPNLFPNLYTTSITQSIVYLPYSEADSLRRRVEYLEDLLREHKIPIDPVGNEDTEA